MKGYISHILWTVSVLLMGTMIISSCDTDLDLTNPSYQTPENYFQNSDELQAATNAIYSNVSAAQLFARE